MVSSDGIIVPKTPAEAYSAYKTVNSAVLVAGSQSLKRQQAHYTLAIDLKHAGLNYIEDRGDEIAIGAMTTMAELETSPLLRTLAGGVIPASLKEWNDTELKRQATIGGLLASKPHFSVLIPLLLSL